MIDVDVLIAGGGLAGASALLRLNQLGIESVLIEKKSGLGGHARSHSIGNHIFDEGPHVFFGEDEEIATFLGAPMPTDFKSQARVGNLWKRKLLSHPAHLDFKKMEDENLEIDLAKSIVYRNEIEVRNYGDWLTSSVGPLVKNKFSDVYTAKYWRLRAEELDLDWISNRVHKPDHLLIDQISKSLSSGTISESDFTKGTHYLQKYSYHSGGFWQLFPNLHQLSFTEDEITTIDLDRKIVTTGSSSYRYKILINTMPLPVFSQVVQVGQLDSEELVKALEWTSLNCMNLVISSTQGIQHDYHWLYNYEEESEVSRISFPDRFLDSPILGHTFKVQAESYWNPKRESKPCVSVNDTFLFLRDNNILPEDSELIESDTIEIEYANIIPLIGRAKIMASISKELDSRSVLLAGRYGSWSYLWSHESARSGFVSADLAKSKLDALLPRVS
jgi:protoporphyrinogen oxidase